MCKTYLYLQVFKPEEVTNTHKNFRIYKLGFSHTNSRVMYSSFIIKIRVALSSNQYQLAISACKAQIVISHSSLSPHTHNIIKADYQDEIANE